MVKGLDIFRERFRPFEGSFTLIGGAACDEWFTAQGVPFRATKDLDIEFLQAFPATSVEWPAILSALKESFGGGLRAETLRDTIQTYFHLPT